MEGNSERILRIYNPNLRTVEAYKSTAQYATLGSGRLADISITLPSLEWEHLRIDFDAQKVTAIGSGVSVDGQPVPQGGEAKLTNDSIVRVHSLVLGVYSNSSNASYYNSRLLQEGRKNPRVVPSLEISHCRCIIENLPEEGNVGQSRDLTETPAAVGAPRPSPFTSTIPGPGTDAENNNMPAQPPIMNSVIGSNPVTSNVVVERASMVNASPAESGSNKINEGIDSQFGSQGADNAGYIRQSYTRIAGDIAGIGVLERQGVPGIEGSADRSYKRVKLNDDEPLGDILGISSNDAEAVEVPGVPGVPGMSEAPEATKVSGAPKGSEMPSITQQLIVDTKKEILDELKVVPKDDLVKALIDKKIEGIKHEIDEEVNGQGDIAVKRRKSVDLGKVVIEKDILEEAKKEVKESIEDMDNFKRSISDNIKEEVRETMNEMVQSEVKESIGGAVAECLNDSNMVKVIADNVREKVEVPARTEEARAAESAVVKEEEQETEDRKEKEERGESGIERSPRRRAAGSSGSTRAAEKIKAREAAKKEKTPALRKDPRAPSIVPAKEVVSEEGSASKEQGDKQTDKERSKAGRGKKAKGPKWEEESGADTRAAPGRQVRKAASARQTAQNEEQPDTTEQASPSKETPEKSEVPGKKRGRGRPRKDSSKANK